jgi:hypothetical protein
MVQVIRNRFCLRACRAFGTVSTTCPGGCARGSKKSRRDAQKPNPDHNYHLLAHERQQTIVQIQNHPGFEEFLLPPKYTKLCIASIDGPVIMLNYTEIQTDAIIILTSSAAPLHLSLNVSASSLAKCMGESRGAWHTFFIHSREVQCGRPHRIEGSSDTVLQSLISWLWEAIVKPVFDVLDKVCCLMMSP